MAKIIDPDNLTEGTEVIIDTTNKTIELAKAGNLSDDGVTGQSFYSFLKERWKDNNDLIPYPFPMLGITPEQFEFINGWKLKDQNSVNLLRDCGFAVKDNDGSSSEEWIGCITLGSLGATDQAYYTQSATDTSKQIVLPGAVNQCIKVYDSDPTDGFDYRQYFKLFARVRGKTYSNADLAGIGVETLTYQAYRFPLSNAQDLKITISDTDIESELSAVTVTYHETPVKRQIGTTEFDFNIVIEGGDQRAERIYNKIQYLLRQNSDIDSGDGEVIGENADLLLKFVGDTLVTEAGVYIDNFRDEDTNRIEFFDTSGSKRVFPFVAAGSIFFNEILQTDSNAIYRMFFTDGFGSENALLVNNKDGNPISGDVDGKSDISFSYDYDGNTQGGRTAGSDVPITIVAIGLEGAQYVRATGTITRQTGNSFSLVSALERNYSNN